MSLLIAETVRGIPHQLKQNNKMDTGAVSRTTRVFAADRTSYSYATNPKIVINLPATGNYDMAYSSLNFLVKYDAGELLVGGASLFRNILLRGSDGRIIAEINDQDVINSLLVDFTMSNHQRNTAFAILSGTGESSTRTSMGANGGKWICIQPLLELCRYERYLPLHLIGKISVELSLQDPRICFKHTADVAYSITNVSYRCDLVQFNAEVEAMLINAWQQDRLRFHFRNWRAVSYSSPDKNALITVQNPDNSVNAVLVVARKVSVTTAQNADSYERIFSGLEEVALSAGTNMFERVHCGEGGAQPFFELQKVLDFSENISITPADWTDHQGGNGKKFVFGYNLEVVTGNPNALAGYSGRGDLKFEFMRKANGDGSPNPPENLLYNVFVLHDQILLCGESSGSRVLW